MIIDAFTSELRWLLTGIFVVVGAGVFYLSSLLSGHNIYRDLNFQVAMLATTIVGLLLFAFSPISYIVFTPAAYIKGYAAAAEAFKASKSTADAIKLINMVHEVTLKFPGGVLYSYLLSAVGAGVIFGCAQIVRPRELILRAVRDSANIAFSIYSYHFTWDEFLHSIKRDGLIEITLKKAGDKETEKDSSPMKGRLTAFSVKAEPKEIMLTMSDSRVLVTRAEEIVKLEVPTKSFKRDKLFAAPTSYALYSLVLLLGLWCVFVSTCFTARFVYKSEFGYLASVYWFLGLLIFAAYVLGISVLVPQILRRDFSKVRSALLLRPFFFCFFSLHGVVGIAAFWFLVDTGCSIFKFESYAGLHGPHSWFFGVLSFAYIVLFISEWQTLRALKKRLLEAIVAIRGTSTVSKLKSLQEMERCLEQVYQEQDLNKHDFGYFENLIKEILTKSVENNKIYESLREEVNAITGREAKFGSILRNDQFAVVSTLRFLIGRQIARESRHPI